MIYEIYQQLRGKAGPRQVEGAKVGLIHNIGGWPGAFTSAVGIFGCRE
jgi:acetyl-CoA C-acetyltransferase